MKIRNSISTGFLQFAVAIAVIAILTIFFCFNIGQSKLPEENFGAIQRPAALNGDSQTSKKIRSGPEALLISESLKRDDIPEELKKRFRRYNEHAYALSVPGLKELIRRSLLSDLKHRFGFSRAREGYKGLYSNKRPTHSAFKTDGALLDYSDSPNTCRDFNKSLIHFQGAAFQYFRETHKSVPTEKLDLACHFMKTSLGYSLNPPTNKQKALFSEEFHLMKFPQEIANDPFFRICRANAMYFVLQAHERACTEAAFALVSLSFTKYPAKTVCLAHNISTSLRLAWGQFEPVGDKQALRRSHLEAYADALHYFLTEDFDCRGSEIRSVWYMFEQADRLFWQTRQSDIAEKLHSRLTNHPDVDPWIREMIRGKFAYRLAWSQNGCGYANMRCFDGWNAFHNNINSAERAFTKASKINPHCPEAAFEMLNTSMAGLSEYDVNFWLGKTLAIQPDFLPAMINSIHYQRPKWGGSLAKMLELGKSFSDNGDYKTVTPLAFVHAFIMANRDTNVLNGRLLKDILTRDQLKQLHDCVTKLAKENEELHGHGSITTREWLQSCAISFSFLANDGPALLNDFDSLEGEFNQIAASDLGASIESPAQLRRAINAKYGQFAELYDRLEFFNSMDIVTLVKNQLRVREILVKAKSIAADLEAKKDLGKMIEVVFGEASTENVAEMLIPFERLNNRVKYQRQFISGNWTYLDFDMQFTDWRLSERDHFKFDSQRTVIMNGDGSVEEKRFTFRHHLPGPRTVEYDIEWITDTVALPTTISTGFWPINIGDRSDFYIGFNPKSKQLRLGIPENPAQFSVKSGYGPSLEKMRSGRMRINTNGKYFEFFLNGRFILRQSNDNFVPKSILSFGNPVNHPGEYSVRYSNIRVRKWDNDPFPKNVDKQRPYFEKLTEKYPGDAFYWRCRGKTAHRANEYELANTFFKKARELGDNSSEVSFFLGDYFDRKSNIDSAMEFYWKAFNAQQEVRFIDYDPPAAGFLSAELHSLSSACAASEAGFRYYWLAYTRPNQLLKSIPFPGKHAQPLTSWQWANCRLQAAKRAFESKDWKGAQTSVKQCFGSAPARLMPELIEQLKSYERNERYLIVPSNERFYLRDLSFPYFYQSSAGTADPSHMQE